jgi:hypothetical protein
MRIFRKMFRPGRASGRAAMSCLCPSHMSRRSVSAAPLAIELYGESSTADLAQISRTACQEYAHRLLHPRKASLASVRRNLRKCRSRKA